MRWRNTICTLRASSTTATIRIEALLAGVTYGRWLPSTSAKRPTGGRSSTTWDWTPRRRPSTDCPQRGRERVLEAARGVADTHGQRQLAARQAFPSASSRLCSSASAVPAPRPSPSCVRRYPVLQRAERDEAEQTKCVLDEVGRHCRLRGLRHLARRAGLDPANLSRVLKGRTKPSQRVLTRLKRVVSEL